MKLFIPGVAVGANKVFFDLFNASGSAADIDILSVVPVVDSSVAVTGLVGVMLFLTRTTAVGTGGTAATFNGTDPTAATISTMQSSESLSGSITARNAPSGGATAGAILASRSVFTEETNAAPYLMIDFITGGVPVTVREGTGIRVVQGSVASVGVIGFDVLFKVRTRGR